MRDVTTRAKLTAGVAVLALLAVPAIAMGAPGPVDEIGTSGTGAGQLSGPLGVAVDDGGNLHVAEYDSARISVFSPAGAFLRAFGTNVIPGGGSGFEVCTTGTGCQAGTTSDEAGALGNPSGMAFDSAGNLYVADSDNHRVAVFSVSGTPSFLRAFGKDVDPTGGSGNFEVCTTTCQTGTASGDAGALEAPYDIALDGSDNVYVADLGNNRISVFSSTPSFLRAMGGNVDSSGGGGGFEVCTTSCQIGASNGDAGSLSDPTGVELDGDDLFVVEFANRRVSAVDPAGAFGGAFGENVVPGGGDGFEVCTATCQVGGDSGGPGSFSAPIGIVFEGENAYVTDRNGSRVATVSSGPTFLDAFGADVIPGGGTGFEVCTTSCKEGLDEPAGAIEAPQHISVDGAGRLYVAEYPSDHVGVFEESSAIEFGKTKRNKRKGTAKLPVTVAGPGEIELAKTKKVKGDSEELVGTGGTVKLLVKARGKAKQKLKEKGKAKVRAEVTFIPLGGDANTETQKVKLKKKLSG